MATAKVNIDGKEIGMRASARIPFEYREHFNRDIFADVSVVIKSASAGAFDDETCGILERLAWILARNAGEHVGDSVAEWLDTMDDVFAIPRAETAILDVWLDSTATTADAKKK